MSLSQALNQFAQNLGRYLGGLIITGKADIRYQITRVTALAVLPVRPWSWQFVMAMALAVLQ